MNTNTSEYEAQAQTFLDQFGLTLIAAYKGDRCPPWDDEKCIHGDRYRVSIRRRKDYLCNQNLTPKSISFDFWNSKRDSELCLRPSAYSVLASISNDANAPEGPEAICDEYGLDRDSRKAFAQAVKVDRFAAKLRAFFTSTELAALMEIQ